MPCLSEAILLLLCDPHELSPAERWARRATLIELDRLTARFANAVIALVIVTFCAQLIRWGLQ